MCLLLPKIENVVPVRSVIHCENNKSCHKGATMCDEENMTSLILTK